MFWIKNHSILLLILALIVVVIITTIFALNRYSLKIEKLFFLYKNGKCLKKDNDQIKGEKIVFFSDLHLGKIQKKKEIKKKIQFLASLDASLYIFGGDLVGENIKKYYTIADIKEIFKPLEKKKCLAVLGNHEFKSNNKIAYDEIKDYYKAGNFIVLEDEIYNFKDLNIYGLKDGNNFPLKYKTINDNGLVILHEGDLFDKISGNFLMLSGHSHGGQIKIPFSYKPINGKKYLAGLYTCDNKSLIVSKGLGCNLFKMRFNAKCDIIIIDYIGKE